MATEQVQFVTEDCHRVGVPRHGDHAGNLRLNPGHSVHVENVDVIETFVAIISSKHVQFSPNSRHRVAGPR